MKHKFKTGDIVFFPLAESWGLAEVICSGRSDEYGVMFLDPFNPRAEHGHPLGHSLTGRLTGKDAESGWWVYEGSIELWDGGEILIDETQINKFNNLLENF